MSDVVESSDYLLCTRPIMSDKDGHFIHANSEVIPACLIHKVNNVVTIGKQLSRIGITSNTARESRAASNVPAVQTKGRIVTDGLLLDMGMSRSYNSNSWNVRRESWPQNGALEVSSVFGPLGARRSKWQESRATSSAHSTIPRVHHTEDTNTSIKSVGI